MLIDHFSICPQAGMALQVEHPDVGASGWFSRYDDRRKRHVQSSGCSNGFSMHQCPEKWNHNIWNIKKKTIIPTGVKSIKGMISKNADDMLD